MPRKIESNPSYVGYARVSTTEQKMDLQLDALERAGVHPDRIHEESLSATAKKRPKLDLAIKALRKGDVLVVWRLDRLARSLRDLINRIEQLEKIGAGFKSLTESVDTTTAGGRLILHVLGAIAEFERQLIAERTSAGMKAASKRGQQMGRPRKMTPAKIKEGLRMVKAGYTGQEIAKKLKVSPPTIYNTFRGLLGKT